MVSASDNMGVTSNAVLLLGFTAGLIDARRADAWYQVDDVDAGTGTMTLKHHSNGNTFRVSVVQLTGTE